MIVLITGLKQSGKSTFATELESYGFKHMQFSAKLKKISETLIQELFDDLLIIGRSLYYAENHKFICKVDWDIEQFKEMIIPSKHNVNKLTFRQFLQYFGTDFVRKYIDKDYWVHNLYYHITDNDNIVVSDVRFFNEIAPNGNHKIVVVGIDRGYDVRNDSHASEIEIGAIIKNKADIVIDSDLPLYDYQQKCRKIIEERILK